jgi:hypothetical protein
MRANPQANYTINDVERFCREYGLTIFAPRHGYHYKYLYPASETTLTILARRPVRAIYIRALVAVADRFREGKNG